MKAASNALKTLLANNSTFTMADLYTFTLTDGTVIRRTSFDVDITLAGNLFTSSSSLLLSRSSYKSQLGVQVDTMTIELAFDSTTIVAAGLPMAQALRRGVFDGALVQVERVFAGTDTSAGSVILFLGKVSHLDNLSGSGCSMAIDSLLVQLQTNLPKNLIQPSCVHTLFDAGCTVVKATYTTAAVALLAGTTVNKLVVTRVDPTGQFDLGFVKFISGLNAGFQTSIKTWTTGGSALLNRPLPFVPVLGDTVTLTSGCDKTLATCTSKFSNAANFAAMPFTPKPETAI